MRLRLLRGLGATASVLVALVFAHDLAFLVRYGSAYGEALAHAGHDGTWNVAVVSVLAGGVGLLLAGLFQLLRLWRAARAAAAGSLAGAAPAGRRSFLRTWLGTALRIATATAVLLTIQENLERSRVGLSTPGVGLLVSPEYPWALGIVLAVAAAVALVISLYRWRRDTLIARIRAARRTHPAARPTQRPVVSAERRPISVLGSRRGLRAPPILLAV